MLALAGVIGLFAPSWSSEYRRSAPTLTSSTGLRSDIFGSGVLATSALLCAGFDPPGMDYHLSPSRLMPLVSVIINVRNGAPTLREAIDSVLQQTFQDWELSYGMTAPRIPAPPSLPNTAIPGSATSFRQTMAAGKARNDAIRQASGAWIAFLDQDDLWLPHKLEKQMLSPEMA